MGCCGGDVEEKDDAKVQVLMNSSPFGVCVDSEADLEELALTSCARARKGREVLSWVMSSTGGHSRALTRAHG